VLGLELVMSLETPITVTPSFSNLRRFSEKPIASLVQPDVSSLG
jgi:hypothetical protein